MGYENTTIIYIYTLYSERYKYTSLEYKIKIWNNKPAL